jgi:hypothetical protein
MIRVRHGMWQGRQLSFKELKNELVYICFHDCLAYKNGCAIFERESNFISEGGTKVDSLNLVNFRILGV